MITYHTRRAQQNRLASHLNATVFWMWFRVLLLIVLTVILVTLLLRDGGTKHPAHRDGTVSATSGDGSVPPSRFK